MLATVKLEETEDSPQGGKWGIEALISELLGTETLISKHSHLQAE